MRAIVVDDSREVRSALRQMLWGFGFEVYEAASGREALERLTLMGRPDLALLDWTMPDMDGFELVRAIRSNPAYEGMRLLMVSARTEYFQILQALDAGVDAYVPKPFNESVLRRQIEQLGLLQ